MIVFTMIGSQEIYFYEREDDVPVGVRNYD